MKLIRGIGRWDLVLLMINSTIGAGIFGLPSKIFGLSGLYSIPAFLLCGFFVFILVLSFAEVSSRFSKTGGPYLYTLSAFGKFPAFLMGWLILITRFATFAALIHLFVEYAGYFHPILQPRMAKKILIIMITLTLFLVNFRGIKNSVRLNNGLAIAKLLPLVLFVVAGLFFITPDGFDFHQPLPSLPSFSKSVFLLVFAFTGFEAIIVNTGEMKHPEKNLPFALMLSIGFVSFFYCLIQVVCIGTLPNLADSEKPIAEAAVAFLGPAGGLVITLGALISIGGTLHTVMLIGSRVPFALSEKKQLPAGLSFIHRKFHTPTNSLILFSVVALLVSLSGSFIYAVTISVISKILILLIVCLALLKLRKVAPDQTGYFKLPKGRIIALTGIGLSLWLLFSSKPVEFRDILITMSCGALFYLVFQLIKHKKQVSGED